MDTRPDFQNKDHPSAPYWLDRLLVFCYKALAWLFLGISIGALIAQVQGFMPIWFFVIHLFGSIGMGWLFIRLFFLYNDRKRVSMTVVHGTSNERAAVARLDALYTGGVRMLEERDLMILELTVFPVYGIPYQTTISQFMTTAEIDKVQVAEAVTFYEDPQDQGYGTVVSGSPVDVTRSDFNTFQADKVYPKRQRTGLWLLIGRRPNLFTRMASAVLIITLFSIGFLSPYWMTDNVVWLGLKVRYFPQKLIFQDKGNFNPVAFRKSYDRASQYIGQQRIESWLFYKSFTQVTLEPSDNPGFVESVTIRGNSVGWGFMKMPLDDQDRMFTLGSAPYDLLKKALDDAATDHDIADIMYIGFRRGIRWGTRDRRIAPDYSRNYVDIHIVFEGGKESLHYNGKTGERLPR
ncbi:hypothetical protein HX021_02625 [Sphingobacterium sp. N143]|uniref:hypothetical protein n=1 Tax=Sphingobacterium sp. N143 TaxID=2746727 RepID=UPI002575E4EF|nr:hypothetical protein [Sphingobacterium sp. N143]MDM1293188.1 hypothetical protein [Sphingobacterium sp. N143]